MEKEGKSVIENESLKQMIWDYQENYKEVVPKKDFENIVLNNK